MIVADLVRSATETATRLDGCRGVWEDFQINNKKKEIVMIMTTIKPTMPGFTGEASLEGAFY